MGVYCLFLTGCSSTPAQALIDSFEGVISPETVDFGSSENSSLSVEAATELRVCGEQSLRLDYDLKPGGYMWVARGYDLDVKGASSWVVKPDDIKWKRYNALSLYMYGSNTGGVIAFDVKDSQGELWRFLLDDDFKGWRKIICPWNEFFVRGDWQPQDANKNEILDFPIKSFQFEPRLAGKGVYYFDCVQAVKCKTNRR